MLVKYSKLVTFAFSKIRKTDYFALLVIRIFLEPITNLKRAIIFTEMTPQLVVA